MTQEEIDGIVREQIQAIAEDAGYAIRQIVAVASAQIQSQIVNANQPPIAIQPGLRGIPMVTE